jgi:hypothetical protein
MGCSWFILKMNLNWIRLGESIQNINSHRAFVRNLNSYWTWLTDCPRNDKACFELSESICALIILPITPVTPIPVSNSSTFSSSSSTCPILTVSTPGSDLFSPRHNLSCWHTLLMGFYKLQLFLFNNSKQLSFGCSASELGVVTDFFIVCGSMIIYVQQHVRSSREEGRWKSAEQACSRLRPSSVELVLLYWTSYALDLYWITPPKLWGCSAVKLDRRFTTLFFFALV